MDRVLRKDGRDYSWQPRTQGHRSDLLAPDKLLTNRLVQLLSKDTRLPDVAYC